MWRGSLAGVLIVLITATGDGVAQAGASRSRSDRVAAIQALRDSQLVRTASLGLTESEGRVVERSDTVLTLTTNGQVFRVSTESIDSLWTSENNLAGGLKWGAALGTLAGLAAGIFINEAFCQDSDSGCQNEDARVIAIPTLTGALTGALVGALIGGSSSRWRLRWP